MKWPKYLNPVNCSNCQSPLEASINFISFGYKGVYLKDCNKCGTKSGLTFIPVKKYKIDLWIGTLKDEA